MLKDRQILERFEESHSGAAASASASATPTDLKKLRHLFMQLRKAANHPFLFSGAENVAEDGAADEELVLNSGKMIILDQLVDRLIHVNKPFTRMAYPDRSHGIYEGENTSIHLYSLMTRYLETNLPPGGR